MLFTADKHEMPKETEKARENLVLTVRIMCIKHKLHSISLHRNGQLHFHNHPVEELNNEINLWELGGSESLCGCARLLYNWRQGYTDETMRSLDRERFCTDGLYKTANKLWRRKHKLRPVVKDTRCEVNVQTVKSWVMIIHTRVATELERRGYSTSLSEAGELKITGLLNGEFGKEEECPSLLFIKPYSNGYLKCFVNCTCCSLITTVIKAELSELPIRFLADYCERQAYLYKLDLARERNLRQSMQQFEKILQDVKANVKIDGSDVNYTIWAEKADSFTMTWHFRQIAPVAAIQISRELSKIQDRIIRLLAANAKRRENSNNYPLTPGGGIG